MVHFKMRYRFSYILKLIAIILLISGFTASQYFVFTEIFDYKDAVKVFSFYVLFMSVYVIVFLIQLIYILTYTVTINGEYITIKTLFGSTDFCNTEFIKVTKQQKYRRVITSVYRFKKDLVYYHCKFTRGHLKFSSRVKNYNLFLQYIEFFLYERRKNTRPREELIEILEKA
ncbi:MAG: hypothetical protein U0L20_07920 [Ruminococcus sp.]|nr:hypothetical protein [Ruminococcus sp.]